MSGFSPTNSLLGTLEEYTNLLFAITYTDIHGVDWPVTIVPQNQDSYNPSIGIDGNKINGYYSFCFHDTIEYRNIDDSFTTVTQFDQINKNTLYGLIHFHADGTRTRTYTYTATANGETKTYTINVSNNWSRGRNNLIKYSDLAAYDLLNIIWLNNNYNRVDWVNNAGSPVRWLNNQI